MFVALACIGGNGQHRDIGQIGIMLEQGDQIEAGDVLQLDIHYHEIGREGAGRFDCQIAIGNRFYRKAPCLQHVAEKLPVEIVVLDNEDALRHLASEPLRPE